jgi:hypothetical protein
MSMTAKWPGVLRVALWIAAGAALGVAAGFLVGWVLWPIEYTEADPTVLEESYQRDYTVMVAAAYSLDGDLSSAQRRLASLAKDDVDGWLLAVTVDHILGQEDEAEIRHLVRLASDLGLESPLMAPYVTDPELRVAPGGDQ